MSPLTTDATVQRRGARAASDGDGAGVARARPSASAPSDASLLRPGEALSAPVEDVFAPAAAEKGVDGGDAELDPEPTIPYPRYGFVSSDGDGGEGGADAASVAHLDTDGVPSGPEAPAAPRGRPMWREFFLFLGPGFMICMAYIDPGNLASDINQGVQCGYRLAWVTLWCTFLGWATQLLGARLSLHTGHDLAWHARHEYPVFPRLALWMISELGVVACDMVEVIGGAVAIASLSDGSIPLWAGVLITAASGFGLLLIERIGMRALEAALAVMVGLLGGAFVYLFFSTDVEYGQAFLGLAWPRLKTSQIQIAIGAIGAIIMPHNLYLHSALVLGRDGSPETPEEAERRKEGETAKAEAEAEAEAERREAAEGSAGASADAFASPDASAAPAAASFAKELSELSFSKPLETPSMTAPPRASDALGRLSPRDLDAPEGLASSPSVRLAPSSSSAPVLYLPPSPQRALRYVAIESAFALFLAMVVNFCIIAVSAGAFYGKDQNASLLNMATLFADMFGMAVSRLWSVGLLAAAFASTVTSTYAGQVIVQGFFGRKINVWWRTAGVRLATLGPTVAVAVAVRGTDENEFENLTNWLNIVQSLVLPFVVVVMARVSCSRRILGGAAQRWPMATLSYLVTLVLVGMNMYLFVSLVVDSLDGKAWGQFLFAVAMIIYCSFLIYLAIGARNAAKGWRIARNYVRVRWLDRPPVGPGPVELWGAPDVHAPARAAAAAAAAAAAVVADAGAAGPSGDNLRAGDDDVVKPSKAASDDDARALEMQPRI